MNSHRICSQTCADWNHAPFPGTDLPNCGFLASAIQTCQNKGKIALISLGGGGANPSFSSDSQAQQFADTLWNIFLGGSSNTRPFGSAVLDGYVIFVFCAPGPAHASWTVSTSILREVARLTSRPS